MIAYVTGGSGVVGRVLVQHLVAAGHSVRALARSASAASSVRAMGAEPIPGDLSDYRSLVDGMTGASAVFHVAGVNEMCSVDPAPMYRANVDGTRNAVRAAGATGVERLVYTSSAVVLGEHRGEVGDEGSKHRGFFLSHYERSKALAEEVAFAEAREVEVVAVNPSSVQGPGRATGTGRLLLDVTNGDLGVMIETDLSIVDIDDCARGHLLALENGTPGSRYVLSGFTMSARQAVALLGMVTGRSRTVRFVPAALATAGGGAAEVAFRMMRRQPPVCREMLRVLQHGHKYDGSKATRDLGLEYTPAEVTIRRTVDWFRSEGLLKSPD